jgi:hypothetical protein
VGLVFADRYSGAASDVLRALKERVAANALKLARNGLPKPPFYLAGQLGGKDFSLHAEGERVFPTREGTPRHAVDLVPPGAPAGSSPMRKPVCPDGSPGTEPPSNADDPSGGIPASRTAAPNEATDQEGAQP